MFVRVSGFINIYINVSFHIYSIKKIIFISRFELLTVNAEKKVLHFIKLLNF